jgi:hypothetical protein
MKEAWLRRAVGAAGAPAVDGIVMLLPDGTSAGWFREHGATADYVTFLPRIRFGENDSHPSFGVMLLTWGDVPDATLAELADMGATFEGPKLQGPQQTVEDF